MVALVAWNLENIYWIYMYSVSQSVLQQIFRSQKSSAEALNFLPLQNRLPHNYPITANSNLLLGDINIFLLLVKSNVKLFGCPYKHNSRVVGHAIKFNIKFVIYDFRFCTYVDLLPTAIVLGDIIGARIP